MVYEIISKISKGSKMDQIYLSKNRSQEGFSNGSYVIIRPIYKENVPILKKSEIKPIFYGLKKLSNFKMKIIQDIFKIIQEESIQENIIITGSFLGEGLNFNDIDILIIDGKNKKDKIKKILEGTFGITFHIIALTSMELKIGLSSDPLYENMLSRCISLKRLVLNIKRNINPQILDFQLLKSKSLINNFETLKGKEKDYLTKNMIAILLFIEGEKISEETINQSIKKRLDIDPNQIKENLLKKEFIKKYKDLYQKIFDKLSNNLKKEKNNESKQK